MHMAHKHVFIWKQFILCNFEKMHNYKYLCKLLHFLYPKKKKHGNLVGSPLQILPLSHDFISVFLSTSIIHEVQDLASCRGVGAASRGINQRLDPPMEGVWLWCLGGFFWDLEHHQFWNLLILSVSWILYHLWKSLWYIFGGASSKPVERCLFSRNMDVFLNIGPFHIK